MYDWLFEPQHVPLPDDVLMHDVALWDVIIRQDARHCEWQQQAVHARPFKHGVYVPQEFDWSDFWLRHSGFPPTPMSFSTRIAALCPAEPITEPAGWQPALHEYSPLTGVA